MDNVFCREDLKVLRPAELCVKIGHKAFPRNILKSAFLTIGNIDFDEICRNMECNQFFIVDYAQAGDAVFISCREDLIRFVNDNKSYYFRLFRYVDGQKINITFTATYGESEGVFVKSDYNLLTMSNSSVIDSIEKICSDISDNLFHDYCVEECSVEMNCFLVDGKVLPYKIRVGNLE